MTYFFRIPSKKCPAHSLFFLILILSLLILPACSKSDSGSNPPSSGDFSTSGGPAEGGTSNGNTSDNHTNNVFDSSAPVVYFSLPAGFYDDTMELALSCSADDAVIYYTTDGNIPDETSYPYTDPIPLKNRCSSVNVWSRRTDFSIGNTYIPKTLIDKANIIRAIAILPDGTKTSVVSSTYFIGINQKEKYGDVPVISLITAPDNLFNYETGIYVTGKTHRDWLVADPQHGKMETWKQEANFTNRGREWERPVSVEFLAPDGGIGFSQDMGLRIMGAASRNALQKSLRLIAREEYGLKSVKYELIPGNQRSDGTGTVSKYKSFVLRNGGNDCDFGKIRDPYLQSLVSHRRFETLQATPCVVFLDGEYWGTYTLTEDYNDNYIENNYGIDNKNVIIVKCNEIEEGNEEDIALYHDMYDFITGSDMSDETNYAKACELLDIGSFVDYCAFNLYIYNEDSFFKNNNWRMWRVRTPDTKNQKNDAASAVSDGRWRMMVYDTEYSTGIYNNGNNFNTDNISTVTFSSTPKKLEEHLAERHPIELFHSLYRSDSFRRELILTMCDMRNLDFERNSAVAALYEMAQPYRIIMPDTFQRFGPDWVIAWQKPDQYFNDRLEEIAAFIKGRYNAMPKIMKKAFNLGNSAALTLSVSDSSSGTVILNNSLLDFKEKFSDGFTGIYFPDYSITLTAVSMDGHSFAGWEYENCTLSDASSASVTVTISENCTIKAIFR